MADSSAQDNTELTIRVKPTEEIFGVDLGKLDASRREVWSLLRDTIPLAARLVSSSTARAGMASLPDVTASVFYAVQGLIAAAQVKCPLDRPPADIDVDVDGNGRMHYRCRHSPAHRWGLDGNPLP